MDVDRVARRLAVWAVVVSLVVVAGTLAAMRWPGLRSAIGLSQVQPAAYAAGDAIDVPAAVYAGADQTLVLFVRSTCGGCQRLKPALARIVAALAPDTSIRTVVVAGPRAPVAEREFARELGLDESHVVSMTLAELKLRMVPTVVLVDRHGRIRGAWEGVPADAGAFVDTVTDLASRPY